MTKKIGGLYSYPLRRMLYVDDGYMSYNVGYVEPNEPFVLLSILETGWAGSCKVLTTQGLVGWIDIGDSKSLVKLMK